MKCPSCGHENPPKARFCNSCSFRLEARCPSCNQTNPPGSTFCNACGASLSQAPPQAPTPAPTPAIPTSFASGRYQVRRFLGEGG